LRRRETADQWLARLRTQDEPIRAEVLSLEQVRQHARRLAGRHRLEAKPRRDRLLARFEENARVLEETYRLLRPAAAEGQELPPAGVWLLENYYLIQAQIRMARHHLPRKYSMELPQLSGGAADGLPRVYDLALELIGHVDGQIDAENLHQFVGAYQEAAHLKLGELWAIPTMLRLALVENLRRVALRIAWHQHDRQRGDAQADAVLQASRNSFSEFLRTVDRLISEEPALSSAFVARFTQRLNGRLPRENVPVQWLTQFLAERGQTVEDLVNLDQQNLAVDQLSISNSISSLRGLGNLDWKEFVEGQSAVERILRQDPAGVYARMSFRSRDHYRHVVERLARRCSLSEEQVARIAVEHAQQADASAHAARTEPRGSGEPGKPAHVGYYLVDRGRSRLERSIGYHRGWGDFFPGRTARLPLGVYLGAILAVWLFAVGGAAAGGWYLGTPRVVETGAGLLVLALFAGAASQFAVSLVNWGCTLLLPPKPIMRLDFSAGIPAEYRTLVAVPTLLSGESAVGSLLEQLEVRYLANQDNNLLFALVTDFPDADREILPKDARLVELVRQGIQQLNDRYCTSRRGAFYLFHRPRKWNPEEGVWMGEERKRGKLAALNRLLRTGRTEAFSAVAGDLEQLAGVRYVITLDTDTSLPRDAGRELVGCMAHLLNRPQLDPRTRLVTEGYSILQPRVATTIPEANRSPFSHLFAGDAGIDPYTSQTSDVYQDAFAEGSFIGKGIYDVYAFEAALDGRFPANRVLSHDLIEGCFARSGLINDVDLFEGFPSRLLADMSRRHRWIRGDWQIAAWLWPRLPTARGPGRNPLSWLSRWKIFDNLRRSAAPLFLLGFLALAWSLMPVLAGYWTLLTAGLLFGPVLISALPGLIRRPEEKPWRLHLQDQGNALLGGLAREAVALGVLPYTVHCHLDAIARTLYRLRVSRRRLLEWTTAGDAEVRSAGGLRDHYEVMWACTVAALAMETVLAIVAPWALGFAAPVLLAWFAGPWIAWRVSQPCNVPAFHLDDWETRRLRRWARQTWHYFEAYAGPRDHWLAPDNIQKRPDWNVAPRTSPTNLGLGLLADLAACDLGYLSATGLIQRTGRTLQTMTRLDRHRGHFYNWYDTRTLQAAEPRYVSSVDSGNLWGAMIALRAGLEELPDRPLVSPRLVEGLDDTLEVISTLRRSSASVVEDEFDARLARLREACSRMAAETPQGPARRACTFLERFRALAEELLAQAPVDQEDLRSWCETLLRQSSSAHRELSRLAFWTRVPASDAMARLVPEDHQAWKKLLLQLDALDARCTLAALPEAAEHVVDQAAQWLSAMPKPESRDRPADKGLPEWLSALGESARRAAVAARCRLRMLAVSKDLCRQFSEMDYRFLFHPQRKLLAIGFNVSEHRLDKSFYDLLASESRLSSFLAISHGHIPQDHWFALGRMVTVAEGEPALLSWAGSMFEYLMPMLLMPSYPNTLLDASCRVAVRRQIRYARRQGVPWGISESCYNQTDANLAYRYRAFGVPGLGLERGLANNLVIAPYASAMAVMVAPREALANLGQLERLGYLSPYGFYDAIDYTPQRRLSADQPAVCRSVMAHHSGMTLLALEHVLLGGPMQRRFLSEPLCRAHALLLQERLPHAIRPVDPEALDTGPPTPVGDQVGQSSVRVFDTPYTSAPEVHLLSNGTYHVMLTNAGGGFSRCGGLAITRWHEDPTRDNWGQFCYLRDLETGSYWSNACQPSLRQADKYQAVFSQGRVEYRVVCEEIDARTQVSVSPEENVEVRRLTLHNLSRLPRTIEATTYAEVVLASAEADRTHRAFSNLFVQTEIIPDAEAILCTRRPREPGEPDRWMFHLTQVQAAKKTAASCETSRERFVGRMRSLETPAALTQPGPLSGSQGAVLDPIVSIRQAVTIASEESAEIWIITGVAETREKAMAAVHRYRDPRLAARVFELSRAQSQLMLQHLSMTEAEAQLYAHLASTLLYSTPRYRLNPMTLAQQLRRQDALWPLGLSGDRPIVLVHCTEPEHSALVEQMLNAHAYWRRKGLEADLVLWLEMMAGRRQDLYEHVRNLVATRVSAERVERPGGVFVRRGDQYEIGVLRALQAAARICLNDTGGVLEEQVKRSEVAPAARPLPRPRTAKKEAGREATHLPPPDLLFFNGLGGFSRDGRQYVSLITAERPTPAPWCNVLANPRFGAVVSESGTGCTWSENAQQFRLTPWSNDPTCDPPGEIIGVSDPESGELFSATPLPVPSRQGYLCRHGFGYTTWETESAQIESHLSAFVSVDQPVKLFLLTLGNRSSRRRTLRVTCAVEWVLGEHRGKTLPYVITEIDPRSGVLLARSPFHLDFGDRVAFLHGSERSRSVTCDRTELLGRNGSPASAAALGLGHPRLSGKAGAGLDPAAAIRCEVELAPGEQRDVVFVLGAEADAHRACQLARRMANVANARDELSRVWEQWDKLLGTVQVETPEAGVNLLANGWLLYQTLACRFWGRGAFYQSGGAYGFRDQLQDSLALLLAAPELTREHLLRSASRQFEAGDVQHWWHPTTGRGIRTRISDDSLWLPLVTCKYVDVTGDWDVLDVETPLLVERPLEPDEQDLFSQPHVSPTPASLYEHCRRAIQQSLKLGPHGLPCIGAGDWNDGMNRVGIGGQGESVWLAFFLIKVLGDFSRLAERREDRQFAEFCRSQAQSLQAAVEPHGWDGRWFRRAYFDDGEPLGSQQNDECRIDSLSQSWAVIAQAAPPPRLRMAMQSVDDHLVRRDLRLIQLLHPAFDRSRLEPGYIKGYLPGVRENGGQYTHAAVWTALAFALLGDTRRAWECVRMLEPIGHAASAEGVAIYKVEPYCMAGDVYTAASHEGRGGWTWYTGSSGWMYQLILESLLGVQLVDGTRLRFRPCPPDAWNRYAVVFRFRSTPYRIEFKVAGTPAHHVAEVTLDGVVQEDREVHLVDDRQPHEVRVTLGVA
jgi:cellobiose phosphorylase